MSRRDERDSGYKRHYSMIHGDTSPKRPRRDGRPVPRRKESNQERRIEQSIGSDGRCHRVFEGTAPDSVLENPNSFREFDKKSDRQREITFHHLNPSDVPRSVPYFQQHDERNSAGNSGRGFVQRVAADHGWRYPMERQSFAAASAAWTHDKFTSEVLPLNLPSVRRRPAFGEKIDEHAEMVKPGGYSNREEVANERGGDVGRRRFSERPPLRTDRREVRGVPSRERYPHQRVPLRVEKWKHDLFDDANRSPTPKNEEEQLAKLEALLAS